MRFTKEEIEEKSADVVIEVLKVLENQHPETFQQIINQIQTLEE